MEMTTGDAKRALAAQAQSAAQNPSASQGSELNGSEILVRCLQAEGVQYLWGYPGGAVLYIYDALYKQDSIQHVLVRHEQAAVHAADGYARATGKVGVALVTSGPGVTNAVTGIATAYLDSIPMVIITGNVPTHAIGQDAFQECDTVGITRPIVKHNFLVKDVRNLASTIKKAFYIAATGRPGPVVVDIPKDVSRELCKYEYPKTIEMRSYSPVNKGHSGQIRKAVSLLLQAERPYIYSGGGVVLAEASEELRQLAALTGYPVTNTLMGLGAFPGTSKQFVGMLGMHGTYEANMAMQNCDVLIAIGARFDDRVIGSPAHFSSQPRKIIHRHRSVVHIQAREGRHPHRRQRQGRAARDDRPDPIWRSQAQQGGAGQVVGTDRAVAQRRLPEVRPHVRDHQAPVRGRENLGTDQW
jgi:acetolactate synthase-1/2/3 large subunit